MLKSLLVPKSGFILDDDEKILFDEICFRPLSFHFLVLSWILCIVLILILVMTSVSLIFVQYSPHYQKLTFIEQVATILTTFFVLFKYYIIDMSEIFILFTAGAILFSEVLLALFPFHIILTTKRLLLYTYNISVKQSQLTLIDIKEVKSIKKWYSFDALKIEINSSNNKKSFVQIPEVDKIKKIYENLTRQLQAY
jgi:hypothetical protein